MSNRLLETTGVVLVMVFFFAGCEQRYVTDESQETVGLNPAEMSAPSGFAAEALKAAGGLDAWAETKKLGLDCVVTFYESDGSFYLTQQHYDVYPWSDAIEISGREPEGDYSWRCSKGQMSVLRGIGQIEALPSSLDPSCYAQAILEIVKAPVSFFEPSAQFNRQDAAVKKQGQWYYPIHRTGDRSGETVFYQNRSTLLVDMIRLPCSGADQSLAARGYDYHRIEKEGPTVPARIEIFSTDLSGMIQKRLVKIDCHKTVQAK